MNAAVPSTPESDIEIVHDKAPPKLHSILKQRSRTTSESSDDLCSSSFSRENSTTTSESPISEGDEEAFEEGGRKKTVSFSEHVDKTSFKTNATVSALHSTLKNKKRRARKREEKYGKNGGKGGRRRRTSSGGSYSSDDLSGHAEDVLVGDAELNAQESNESAKVKENTKKNAKESEDAKTAHTPQETKDKSGENVAKKPESIVTPVLESSGDDLRESGISENQEAPAAAGSEEGKPQSGNPAVKPDESSITENNELKTDDIADENEVFRDPKSNESGDNKPDVKANNPGDAVVVNDGGNNGNNSKKSKNKKKNKKNKQVKLISEISTDEDDKKPESEEENKTPEEKSETILNWGDKQAANNVHKTQCAFDFSNKLMYDLDED